MGRRYTVTEAVREQRRLARAAGRQVSPLVRRKILRLAGTKSASGRWAMSVRKIGKLVGLTGGRVQQILAEHEQRSKASAA
jgi:hypothetical protein